MKDKDTIPFDYKSQKLTCCKLQTQLGSSKDRDQQVQAILDASSPSPGLFIGTNDYLN